MKRLILSLCVLMAASALSAQKLNEMPNFGKYQELNKKVMPASKKEKRVVLLGNSITEGWPKQSPDFFSVNNYISRGISGQTSPQLLLRFRKDVVELQPVAVVINVGTNDIAENSGKYDPEFTMDNIKSMAEIAKANGIKVILSSVLPVSEYSWRKDIKDVPQTIDALNEKIKEYAKQNKFAYIDYNSPMRNQTGGMIVHYATDGVHPTAEGYAVMEKVAKKVIDKVIK